MAHILKQPSLLLCSLPFQTLSKVSIQYFSLKKTFTGDKWRCNAGNLRTQRTVFLTIVCIDDVHYSKFSPSENLLIKCQPLHSPPLLSQTQALGGIVSEPMFLSEESASHTHNQDQPTMKIFFSLLTDSYWSSKWKNLNRMPSDMKSGRFLLSCTSLCHTHLSVGTLSD